MVVIPPFLTQVKYIPINCVVHPCTCGKIPRSIIMIVTRPIETCQDNHLLQQQIVIEILMKPNLV
ncbi:MAG: hypothetical protein KatS3mg056_2166 [Chloroflexus sp.]|nr:MAG: hypothetical protein KatS3mg056_2166 [Chloroflexus sp.]